MTDGCALFRAFLQREHSEENIDFWLAVHDFKTSTSDKEIRAKAQKIYDEFVAVQSVKEVINCILNLNTLLCPMAFDKHFKLQT
jgi:hypothetical protein